MKTHKNIIITGIIALLIFSFAFLYSGGVSDILNFSYQKTEDNTSFSEEIKSQKQDETLINKDKNTVTEENISNNKPSSGEKVTVPVKNKISDENFSGRQGITADENTSENQSRTEQISLKNPLPVEPENAIITNNELACTLSVRCDTILNSIDRFDSKKIAIIPSDGIVFPEKTVTFYEGESVFNVLIREMKRNKIHLEFVNTPLYKSAYIEGIANIYELDCGELSGWMYKVNGWFPNYGCSRYELKNGDKIEWVYTCDLGKDVGGEYSARNGY